MERHILWEGNFSGWISSSWSQGMPKLARPCKPYRQRRPKRLWSAAYPWPDSRFSDWTLSKSNSYHVVSFRLHTCSTGLHWRTAIPCLLITTWQLVKAHGVTRNEPKIQSLYNTMAMKGLSALPKAPALLETPSYYLERERERESRCILQPQPTGPCLFCVIL